MGILLPFLGKDDAERRRIINTIGPLWDGNEVWLLTAGGAMFAAFPNWYATLFSGFYLALLLMLVALIVRGVAFEFRSKDENPAWRAIWDWVIFIGSAVPALLWGVAFGNLLRGVPIDAGRTTWAASSTCSLPTPSSPASRASPSSPPTAPSSCTSRRTDPIQRPGPPRHQARGAARHRPRRPVRRSRPTCATDAAARLGVNPGLVPMLAVGSLLAAAPSSAARARVGHS